MYAITVLCEDESPYVFVVTSVNDDGTVDLDQLDLNDDGSVKHEALRKYAYQVASPAKANDVRDIVRKKCEEYGATVQSIDLVKVKPKYKHSHIHI